MNRPPDAAERSDTSENPSLLAHEHEPLAQAEADTTSPPPEIVRSGGALASLRIRDFRLFWSGALASNIGTWMQTVALGLIVYELTRSEFALGVVNFLAGIPVFIFALWGGALADRYDRRRLIIGTQWALAAQAVAFGLLYTTGVLTRDGVTVAMVAIGILSLFGGVASALAFPAWQAMVPDIVDRDRLLNALALNAAQFNTARLLGPLAAAAVLSVWNAGGLFYLNAASYGFVILALAVIHPRPVERTPQQAAADGARSLVSTVREGLSYARSNRCVRNLLVSIVTLTVFGMPMATLLPAIADKVFGRGAQGYTQLMAANGLGAVAGALLVAGLKPSANRGRVIRIGLTAMSLFLIAFSFTRSYPVAFALSALSGAAFLASVSAINTSLQASSPQAMRGRVMSLFVLGFMGIMPFSALLFGAIGRAIGPSAAVGAGAVLLLAYAGSLWLRPDALDAECAPAAPGAAAAK